MKMIKNYLEYIEYTRCLSKYTVLYREWALKRFNLFLGSIGKTLEKPEDITMQDIYSFNARMSKNGMSENTIHGSQMSLRDYFHYLSEILNLNVLDREKIKGIRVHEKNIGFYDEKEKSQILNALDKGVGKKEITQLRNKVLTYMLLHTGLRRAEIAKIKVSEIGESLQVIGKGGKRRVVFLRKELLDMIEEYLSKRKSESEWLFPSHNKDGGHIREKSIVNIYLKMSKELGIHIHAHKFRHTFATDLLHLPGSNIYDVAKLMGHNSITTTQIYLGTNNEWLKKLQFGLSF